MPGAAIEIVERGAAAIARGADQVADLRRALRRRLRDEDRAWPLLAFDHALDIDRVGLIGTEEVARHTGARDVPGNERGRPRDVVEAGAVGLVDACPVVVDAFGCVALLDALLLGARRCSRRIDR